MGQTPRNPNTQKKATLFGEVLAQAQKMFILVFLVVLFKS